METKRSTWVQSKDLPLAAVASGANSHGVKLLAETLNVIVTERPLMASETAVEPLCSGLLGIDFSMSEAKIRSPMWSYKFLHNAPGTWG